LKTLLFLTSGKSTQSKIVGSTQTCYQNNWKQILNKRMIIKIMIHDQIYSILFQNLK